MAMRKKKVFLKQWHSMEVLIDWSAFFQHFFITMRCNKTNENITEQRFCLIQYKKSNDLKETRKEK